MGAINNPLWAPVKALITGPSSYLHLHGIRYPFDKQLSKVGEGAAAFSTIVRYVEPFAENLPEILGSTKARNYLIAFQNNAEARGTGGIIGTYAILHIDAGKASFTKIGSNADLVSQNSLPLTKPAEFTAMYGNDPAIWQNSNLSPHFPYGASIWLALWQKQFGQKLDGVITADPFVLKAILEATGPVQVNGDYITAANVVEKTLSTAYIKYADNNSARKAYLVAIVEQVVQTLLDGQYSRLDLLAQLKTPLTQRRILFYSSHPKEEALISESAISGTLPIAKDNSYYLNIINSAGNKMDYYIQRKLAITTLTCGSQRETQVDISITNKVSAKAKLPNYVAGRLDLGSPSPKGNSTFDGIYLYGPVGAKIGEKYDLRTERSIGHLGHERGREVAMFYLELKPNDTQKIRVIYQGGTGAIKAPELPLVLPQETLIKDRCSQ